MKLKFIHPTAAQSLKLCALALSLANTALAVGATLTGVPDSLKGLSACWPVIYGIALVIHQLASVFGVTAAPAILPTPQ